MSFDLPPDVNEYHWSQGGQAIDYVTTRAGVSNLWRQSVTGGSARRLTDFNFGRIFSFAWSAGGKQLVLARGNTTSDVILISNVHQ